MPIKTTIDASGFPPLLFCVGNPAPDGSHTIILRHDGMVQGPDRVGNRMLRLYGHYEPFVYGGRAVRTIAGCGLTPPVPQGTTMTLLVRISAQGQAKSDSDRERKKRVEQELKRRRLKKSRESCLAYIQANLKCLGSNDGQSCPRCKAEKLECLWECLLGENIPKALIETPVQTEVETIQHSCSDDHISPTW